MMRRLLSQPKVLSVCFMFVMLLSCSKEEKTSPLATATEVQIRLSNSSAVTFEDATYNNVNFGDIAPGVKTEYKTFESSYRYGIVRITIAGDAYGWGPIDYVGETLLKPGNYTFDYSFDSVTRTLTDELIKDDG